METLAVICIIAFSICGASTGIYLYKQRKSSGMKQSPSLENLANIVVEDPA